MIKYNKTEHKHLISSLELLYFRNYNIQVFIVGTRLTPRSITQKIQYE